MIDIVEQAKQSPRNATPLGWDATHLRYPGVNTCLTVSTIGKARFGKTNAQGMLVGLHLGLFMGAGQEGGAGSEDSAMISPAHLGLYLDMLVQHAWVRGGGAERIYIAGAVDVWRASAPTLWRQVQTTTDVWHVKMHAPVEIVRFDDDVCATVDINVTRAGVGFTTVGGGAAVPVLV